eukprot:TRINITY_DN4707_c0_g1_i1.p1 TRINITY_DN4707_c0_g1~~TRINITY_DN4707_c0_g1_i1.p1  ORF type:complete len:1648 (+),score=334.87 TRINITY_DN4707_c0_g1_i1:109-4944(+)
MLLRRAAAVLALLAGAAARSNRSQELLRQGVPQQTTTYVPRCPGRFCLLMTHGGWSFYRVRIDPSNWPAGQLQKVTDDVVYSTCYQASFGQPPPCMGASDLCRFYSRDLCQATSELGCEQPMLTTAIAMGCSSPLDPNCEQRLVGGDTSVLWASMGGKWGGAACGRVGMPENEQVFCSSGTDYAVDGEWWTGCDAHTPPCPLLAPAGTPAANTRTLQHYAMCVGKTVCTCVHGECDIASDMGYCVLGSCSKGWSGSNCNIPCIAAFCNGRNDPAAANGGVTVNALNQCVCTCLPQWGPGGVDGCSQCTLPGSHECVAYTAQYLATTSQVSRAVKGQPVRWDLEARFQQNHMVDPNVNTQLLAQLNPGGGNGGGGPITIAPNPIVMVGGRGSVTVTFGSACDQCVIVISDMDTSNPSLTYRLQPLVLPPVEVTGQGTRMVPVSRVESVAVNQPFGVTLEVHDADGNVDRSASNQVRVSLEQSSLQGSQAQLTPATTAQSLTQTFSRGRAQWDLRLTRGCAACYLVFEDQATLATLERLRYGPIRTIGTTAGLKLATPPPPVVHRGEVFDVVIEAIDVNGDFDPSATGIVELSARSERVGQSDGTGGNLLNQAGLAALRQPLEGGRVRFALQWTEACARCIITARDVSAQAPGALGAIDFPPMQALTRAVRFAVIGTTPREVTRGVPFNLAIAAVDERGHADAADGSRLRVELLPGGGNGDGGALSAADGLLARPITRGNATWTLTFSRACDTCDIRVSDLDTPTLDPVTVEDIVVRTTATKLGARSVLPTQVPRATPFSVTIGAVDDNGDVDRKATGKVAMRLAPGGGNGDGGQLSNAAPLASTLDLALGEVTFRPQFSDACAQCVLEFRHENPSFPVLSLPPMTVSTSAVRYRFVEQPPAMVKSNTAFTVIVQAIDDAGNNDVTDRGLVRMELAPGGGNGDGGTLYNDGSRQVMSARALKGRVSFTPSFSRSCAACVLRFVDAEGGLPVLRSEPIVVSSPAVRLAAKQGWANQELTGDTTALTVGVRQPVTVEVTAIDIDGFVDMASAAPVTAVLNSGGGNGGGAPLLSMAADNAGLARVLTKGSATFTLGFGQACARCSVSFTSPGLQSLLLPPIKVSSDADRLVLVSDFPTKVAVGQVFEVVIQVRDGQGNVDTGWEQQLRLELLPGGGNGDGGQLLDGGSPVLSKKFAEGEAKYQLSLSAPCTACFVIAEDRSGQLSVLRMGPLQVATGTAQLTARFASPTQRSVQKDVAFDVIVTSTDAAGNVNTADNGEVSAYLGELNAQGDVTQKGLLALETTLQQAGELTQGRPLTKQLRNGVVGFSLIIKGSCTACVLVFDYSGPSRAVTSAIFPVSSGAAASTTGGTGAGATRESSSSSDDGLPGWAIAVIILVILAVCIAAAILLFLCMRKHKRKKGADSEREDASTEGYGAAPQNGAPYSKQTSFSDDKLPAPMPLDGDGNHPSGTYPAAPVGWGDSASPPRWGEEPVNPIQGVFGDAGSGGAQQPPQAPGSPGPQPPGGHAASTRGAPSAPPPPLGDYGYGSAVGPAAYSPHGSPGLGPAGERYPPPQPTAPASSVRGTPAIARDLGGTPLPPDAPPIPPASHFRMGEV